MREERESEREGGKGWLCKLYKVLKQDMVFCSTSLDLCTCSSKYNYYYFIVFVNYIAI